jgi:hypothetical protein
MAHPAYIQKTLVMKPEVSKIFDDLEEWHNHCRMELINFDPVHLYKSREYKEWQREKNKQSRYQKRDYRSGQQSN